MFLQLFTRFADACNADATFFGVSAWYKYLVKAGRMITIGAGEPQNKLGVAYCDLKDGLQWKTGDITLILMGVLEMVLRIAGLVAIAFVIYGGISYITSQGQPDKTKNAQETIINALVGLVIAMLSVAVVSFIGQRLG